MVHYYCFHQQFQYGKPGKVTFLKDIRFYGYQQIMDDARIWMGYANTILYVVAGTIEYGGDHAGGLCLSGGISRRETR
ncbi:MAG: hypothetical protein ACLVAW_05020 [Eisenbergiella massiliensis]